MQIKNITKTQLTDALILTNVRYQDNLVFFVLEPLNQAGTRWKVRIKTRSYDLPGYRRTHSGRRHPSACWHAHGWFYENIFKIAPDAVIRSGQLVVTAESGNWVDWQIGSMFSPVMFSEACDCQHRTKEIQDGHPSVYPLGVLDPRSGRVTTI